MPVSKLDAPDALSDVAQKYWHRLSAQLHDMGVLTEADAHALHGLCEALADAERARASLARPVYDGDGHQISTGGALTYTTLSKVGVMIRARPEIAMIADADRRIAMWLAKFGMTPADRSRVSADLANGPDPDSPWARFERLHGCVRP